MDTTHLPLDFREFIRFINSAKVEYLLVGGYAVSLHGAPRFTADMDIWVNRDPDNAVRLGSALQQFGFTTAEVVSGQFLKAESVFRIGRPPLQIDLLTDVSGRDFLDCYSRREVITRDGIEISIISLADLKINKQAAGRAKDLGDLESLG